MLLSDKKVSTEQKVKKYNVQEFYCLIQVSNLANSFDVMPDMIASKYAVFYLNEIKLQKQCIWSKLLTGKSNLY